MYERLTPVPKTAETILAELWEKGEYLDIAALHRALMELELSGYVRQSSPGFLALLRIDKDLKKGYSNSHT